MSTAVTNRRVSWGPQAWEEARVVLDDALSVDKARLLGTTGAPAVFVVHGLLDQRANPAPDILAYNKIPTTNTSRYLFVGPCGAGAPCGTNNATKLRDKVKLFLDRWLNLNTGTTVGGPIFFTVPAKAWDHDSNATTPRIIPTDNWGTAGDGTPQVDSDGVWPPPLVATETRCFLNNGTLTAVGGCGSVSTSEAAQSITNPKPLEPYGTACACLTGVLGYSTTPGDDEFHTYTTAAVGNDGASHDRQLVGVTAFVHLSSTTTRTQVQLDAYEVPVVGGVEKPETRIWQGSAFVVPVARNQGANTVVRVVFKPGGSAWRFDQASKLRFRIASRFMDVNGAEPLAATYSIKHASPTLSGVILQWATWS
jgi:hypothetical protein